jgi:5-carboxymethyl-2-hydroxymuconate isomerase
MPHLTLEYSANLRAAGDFGTLVRRLAATLVAESAEGRAVYPTGGVRVRALACEDYCIADGQEDAAFVHAVLKIGAGRPPQVVQATGDHLFDVMKDHFARVYAKQGLALSLEVGEFSEAGTWKHNNLHARFRKD